MGTTGLIPIERIEKSILLIRGQKVMLSPHLAELYDIETRVLMQAVKRNLVGSQMILCFHSREKRLGGYHKL